jgi:protoporphyrinogen oxidase
MVPDAKKTSLGLEYFCTQGDELWQKDDINMINFALNELEKIGIVYRRYLIDAFVVRQPNAYPFYSMGYLKNVNLILDYLSGFCNLQTIGRSGLFRYDNSDHSLLTGIRAANNFLDDRRQDPWQLNMKREYIES